MFEERKAQLEGEGQIWFEADSSVSGSQVRLTKINSIVIAIDFNGQHFLPHFSRWGGGWGK